jgi:peptidylprolyl isomerase
VPTQRDYYAILQVSRNAKEDDIARAYERLSRQFDPASSRKPRAAQRYAEIQEAYETLGDREKRRAYDRGTRRSDPAAAGTVMPSDVLSNRFVLVAAGTLVASIAAIVAVILLFGGGDDEDAVVIGTGTGTPAATITLPAQTPGTPAETPPDVTGEEVVLENGLTYIDVTVGTGEEAKTGDWVAVNYSGWLQSSGARFDSSISRPETFGFTIGLGEVIDGWDLGVPGMREGGERRLIIPAALAYGDVGRGETIPPGSTLIFDIILVDILTPAAAATPTPLATLPVQTPGVPPESPPEITGEQITLESGLVYIDIEEGAGEPINTGDAVAVNYTGWLSENGTMFDSSVDNPTPFQLILGATPPEVIQGWEQGLPGMREGGKRRLIIPPALGYGAQGQGDIPPNAGLVFDVELVSIIQRNVVAPGSATGAP